LTTLDDLREYCFVVAGVVGEMLTEIFVAGGALRLSAVAADLRKRARSFGEALQLVNILKDAHRDAKQGRIYLPRNVVLSEVFALVRADLDAAAEYVRLLQLGGAHPG